MMNANLLSVSPAGGPALEVLQYRSVGFHIITGAGAGGSIIFEGSNDGANWASLYFYESANANAAPIATVTMSASASRLFLGPLPYRFFRIRVTSALSGGPTQAIARFSLAPFTLGGPLSANLSSISGTVTVTGGVGGLLGVGGNIAPGLAPTANPVPIGGVESYPASMGTPKTRRILTDNFGNQTVVGPDPTLQGVASPVITREAISGVGLDTNDMLFRILVELRSLNYLMQELPLYLHRGLDMDDDPTADFADEVRIQN
jgi:hypothetical protein